MLWQEGCRKGSTTPPLEYSRTPALSTLDRLPRLMLRGRTRAATVPIAPLQNQRNATGYGRDCKQGALAIDQLNSRGEAVRILVQCSHQLRVAPDFVGHGSHAVHEVLQPAHATKLTFDQRRAGWMGRLINNRCSVGMRASSLTRVLKKLPQNSSKFLDGFMLDGEHTTGGITARVGLLCTDRADPQEVATGSGADASCAAQPNHRS